jgi:hypothetical protein
MAAGLLSIALSIVVGLAVRFVTDIALNVLVFDILRLGPYLPIEL